MKIRKASHLHFLIHSFFSLDTYVTLFIYHTDKNRRRHQGYWKKLPSHPSYGQICKRINKRLKVGVSSSIDDGEYIILAVDSTGIKVTNRGQWMSDKWGLGKKGYLKIHVV